MITFFRRALLLLPWRRRAAERDMQDELRAIAEMADPRELGNLTLAAEDARAEWGWTRIELVLRDIRYGFRGLRRNPGFAATAILSLALGIGANTALFSLWNGVLRASLPAVDHPEQLVILTDPDSSGSWTGRWEGRTDGPRAWLTYAEFEDLRDHSDAFAGLMASQSGLNTWRIRVDGGEEEEARGRLVSGTFFSVLGVGPSIGRLFSAEEDRRDAPLAVISHSYWQRRFAGRSDVLGRTLTVRNTTLTIIGVSAAGFIGETSGQQPDLWLPLRLQPAVIPGTDRLHDAPPEKSMWLHAFGRLKPGVTLTQADTQVNVLFQRGLETFYGAAATGDRRAEFLDQHLRVQSGARGASQVRSDLSDSLTALLAGVGVLLLIACANLANLLLARGAARQSEMALRLSLGASRWRLVRQLVTESLSVAALGSIAAIAVASGLFRVLVQMLTASNSRFSMTFSLDPVVVVFLTGTTVAATMLFGVLPAWQVTRGDVTTNLRTQSRSATGSLRQMRSGRVLVGVQLALSLPLLFGAGLLVQTFRNLQGVDLGFPTERLLLARVDLREAADDETRREQLRRELLGQLQHIPGVTAASYSHLGIFSGGDSAENVEVEGYAQPSATDHSGMDIVGPGYFSTLGIAIRLGRDIRDSDRADAPRVCVINQAFARRYFEGRNPLGLRITTVEDNGTRTAYQVVGVADNARTFNLRGEIEPRFFAAANQPPASDTSPTFLIRTATAKPDIDAVRSTIRRVNAALPIMSVRTVGEQMAPLTAEDRVTAQLAIAFGIVALMLAAVGLYGVLSYGVTRRRGEIAIRMALGAMPRRVISMILRETSGLVVMGLVVGGALTYETSRLMTSQLYGIAPQDLRTLVFASALLLVVALVAAFLPARRASKLNPISVLRL